jgi:uncharacterized protein
LIEFDWDEDNTSHIARHNVNQQEIEELFDRNPIELPDDPVNGEERLLAYGITAQGRLLTVAYTERNGKVRPITAWDMTQQERKGYGTEILENL